MNRLLGIAIVCLLWSSTGEMPLRAQEPSYDGRTLSQWRADLAHVARPNERQRRAIFAIGKMGAAGAPALEDLLEPLRNGDPAEIRWYTLDTLGRMGPAAKEAVPKICVYIPPNRVVFKINAAKALGRIGVASDDAIKILETCLADKNEHLQVAAAISLWQLSKHPKAIPTLQAILSEGDEGAFQACIALIDLTPNSAIKADNYINALKVENPDVRRASAKGLSVLGADVLVELAVAMKDSSVNRQSALVAMGYLADQLRTETLYNARTVDQDITTAYTNFLNVVEPVLTSSLGSPDEQISATASHVMAKLGLFAIPALLKQLQSDDQTQRLRAAATLIRLERFLPGETELPSTMQTLQKRLVARLLVPLASEVKETRASTIRLFAALKIGAEGIEAAPLLQNALRDDNVAVRRYAADALSRLPVEPTPEPEPEPEPTPEPDLGPTPDIESPPEPTIAPSSDDTPPPTSTEERASSNE